MRSVVTDRVAWSVTLVSPTKTAEPIEMPFWVEDSGAPREPCIRWGLDAPIPWDVAILRGKERPVVKHRDTAVICAKSAEPIEMPFQL